MAERNQVSNHFRIFLGLFYGISLLGSSICVLGDIANLDELYQAIDKGVDKKVGFLSEANFDSVHTVLPSPVSRGGPLEVVICDGEHVYHGIKCSGVKELVNLVKNGTLAAGLINSQLDEESSRNLHVFSSKLVSPRALLMRPDFSQGSPHGAKTADESSLDLAAAINAAIVRVQTKGTDQKIRMKNMPFEFINVHTCKSDDFSSFVVPNKSAATGLLKKVLDSQVLKLGALGPYNWHQDGNYVADPPTGFYPDLMQAILEEFQNLSGLDGVKYGDGIKLQRIWQNSSSSAVFSDLFKGNSYLTEPYYIIDGNYKGTWDTCVSDADCLPALLPPGNKEYCKSYKDSAGMVVKDKNGNIVKRCQHPDRPRINFFRLSCTTVGLDSTFFTRKSTGIRLVQTEDNSTLSPWVIFGIILFVCMTILLVGVVLYLVARERYGRPVFMPLNATPQMAEEL